MKRYALLLFACLLSSLAFSQKSNKEKALDALIEAGMVRRQGNDLIFRVNSYSDTAQYKLIYAGLIDNPNIRMRFETASSVAAPKPSVPLSNTGLNTSGQAQVNPNDLSQLPAAPGPGPAFSNMKLFGYAGTISPDASQQFTEHTWTVPPGVTKLKLEGWSAGADGSGEDFSAGGGGGGGAYFLSMIEVEPGDNLRIRVPASGKNLYPLIVQFMSGNKGSITLRSGSFPVKEVNGVQVFDGKGGFLDQSSGVFDGNTFSIRGEDGEKFFFMISERISGAISYNRFYLDGKKGGNAPRGGFGGKGARKIDGLEGSVVPATDGIFPGGGGGGGLEGRSDSDRGGRGASGLLIIYY